MTDDRSAHWDDVWEGDEGTGRSWFQPSADDSMALVRSVSSPGDAVIDVGGGASPLVDALLDAGYVRPAVVDISAHALEHARRRLGARAASVQWVVGDVTTLDVTRRFDVWHDRAVLHFLVSDADRRAYVEAVLRHLAPGGRVILATFSPDGPTSCSGLPIRQYDADAMQELLGPTFDLVSAARQEHRTPSGAVQDFQWGVFRHRMA